MKNSQGHVERHIPVMQTEVLSFFAGRKINVFFDGTLGAGGHAKALLQDHPEIQTYIGCDLDPEALAIAKESLMQWKDKVVLIHGNFADLDQHLAFCKIKQVDGFFLI